MPAADPITAIGNALSGISENIQPFIEEYHATKPEADHRERLAEWQKITVDGHDPKRRADRIHGFVVRLLADSGQTVRGVGTCIGVPVDVLDALITECSESVMFQQKLARLQFRKP